MDITHTHQAMGFLFHVNLFYVIGFQFYACIQHIHRRISACVFVLAGCFDVCLADTAAYLRHITSTYHPYIISVCPAIHCKTHFSWDTLIYIINCK